MLKFLIVLATAAIPFVVSFHLNFEIDVNEQFKPDDNGTQNMTISLDQFSAFKELGKGGAGSVYLARKNGGLDDGKLYALKAINIPHALEKSQIYKRDMIKDERDILISARQWRKSSHGPLATGLQYSFFEGKWQFFVLELGIGGTVRQRLRTNPDAATTQLILAIVVSLVERIHYENFAHGDISFSNILLDSNGRFILTDFGYSKIISDDKDSKYDWKSISQMCDELFSHPNDSEWSVRNMLRNMSDALLPELKSHPYFNGIDWQKIAEEKFDPPFEASEMPMDLENPMNLREELKIDGKDELDATLVERFRSYSFIAPEHQY